MRTRCMGLTLWHTPWLFTILAMWAACVAGEAEATIFRQVPYSQGGVTVPKLTRTFTNQTIGRELFGRLGSVCSSTYRDPDTGNPVYLIVGVDPLWNRIVWSTSYENEAGTKSLGSFGSGPDEMDSPADIALASNGALYLADTGNHRVKVFMWIADNGVPSAERFFTQMFTINGGADFTYPDRVLWDDNGTPTSSIDDILWVLDRSSEVIVGYHITLANGNWSYSRYVRLALKELFLGPSARYIVAITKARSYSSGSEYSTTCTEDLIAYDSVNDSFLRFAIPRVGGEIVSPGGQVALTTSPNPLPGTSYERLVADSWGNILCVDHGASRIIKLNRSLQLIGTFGTRGTGGLGSNQMYDPVSLTYHIDKPVAGSAVYGLSRDAVLAEAWGDFSGIQALRTNTDITAGATLTPGSASVTVRVTTSDDGRLRIRILDGQTGAEVRTLSDQNTSAGTSETIWDGRTNSGGLARRCVDYQIEARVASFYAEAETALVITRFYYKPPVQATVTIGANIPGAVVTWDGGVRTLNTTAAIPCSVCVQKTLTASPTQVVNGTRYCFNYWSNGGFRKQGVRTEGDSTINLNLTVYSGPTTVPVGATLYDDAYDCKSPYLFQGSATLTTASPTDSFHTWGSVKFRMPKNVGAKLTIARPFVGKALKFESTDSTIGGQNLWEGIRLTSAGSLVLDSCEVRSARYGVWGESGAQIDSLALDRCTFENNLSGDVYLNFDPDPAKTSTARLFRSNFQNASGVSLVVGGTSSAPVATATISECKFTNAGPNGSLSILGGWTGPIQSNTFTLSNNNAYGVRLFRNGSYASPSVSFAGNKFAVVANGLRKAMLAPAATGNGLHIDARNNDWSYYTTAQIEDLIDHGMDAQYPTLTIVDFQPWTPPPGGGGGGGGGCPFVLTRTDAGYAVENSILGRSEIAESMVEDACPLREPVRRNGGTLQVRIAELESDTDVIDRLGLGAVEVPDGYELSTDESGQPMLVQWPDAGAEELARSSKITAFISPVAPGSAYSGAQGDSLDLLLPDNPVPTPGKRRIGINMIPKPPEASTQPGLTTGVIIRASSDKDGDRWITIGRLLPREHWSTETIGLGDLDAGVVRRLRLVWQSQHTLGRIGLVNTAEVKMSAVPAISAHHSDGTDVSAVVQRQDWQSVTLRPGEHIDLEYDIGRVPATSRLVLLAHGRYFPPGVEPTAEVPVAYFLGQNHPNPFNPVTAIEYGIPARGRVTIRIFDVAGRLVRTLVNQELPAGYHRADWDGRTASGTQVGSGIYFYELRSNLFSQKRRMVLIR